jgi:hypothetical protein
MWLILAIAALSVPSVDCAERAEPSPPPPTAAGWIVAGPVAWPRLLYRQATRLAERPQDADRVLRFRPCAPGTPYFSGAGTVGPRTGYPGALIADRRKCVRVRVTRGGRRWTARIPLGRRCR